MGADQLGRPGWSMPHRLARLAVGQLMLGISAALLVRAGLGNMPWDVLHQGVALGAGWSLGATILVASIALLLLWMPLRVRPGLGTVTNVVLVAVGVDASLAVIPPMASVGTSIALLVAGTLLGAVATALYVGVDLGPGPRDGLMTGLVARTGGSVRLVRATIEVTVVAVGFALGGTLGLGTLAFALSIGPLLGWLMPHLAMPRLTD